MGLLSGGSRSIKPCVFPCKVAAAGDEGQLLCEAVAGRFDAQSVLPWRSATCGCKSHCNGCMNVHVLLQNAV